MTLRFFTSNRWTINVPTRFAAVVNVSCLYEEDPIGRSECRLHSRADDRLALHRIERGHDDRRVLRLRSDCGVEEMDAIRKEIWMAMGNLLSRVRERRYGNGNASASGNAEEGSILSRSEQNHAVSIPRAAMSVRGVANRLRWPPADIDPLQFSASKEPEDAAVRRPEWKARPLGADERPRARFIHGAQPDHAALVRSDDGGHVCRRARRQLKRRRSGRRFEVEPY